MSDVRRGWIEYRDGKGRSRGRESFSLSRDADGLRTLQATCEIDATRLVRHVVQTADDRFRPVEAYVRVTKDGRFTAAGWLCFDGSGALVATQQAGAPPTARRVETAGRALAFGSHPLIVDGWMAAGFDLEGPGVQPVRSAWVSSYEVDGSGTVDCLPVDFGLEYAGRERVTTQAGCFECLHFRYRLEDSAIVHPPYETWVTADGEYTLVRARMGGPTHYQYELTVFDPA